MKQYEYKELFEFIDVESDYKCGACKFRDDVIKSLMNGVKTVGDQLLN